MRFVLLVIVATGSFLISCNHENDYDMKEKFKKEIIATEYDFAKMAGEVGIKEAFLAFAADSAVLSRGDVFVKGSIRKFYDNNNYSKIELDWKPDFVDVSSSGDLGYTYGKYHMVIKDKDWKDVVSSGIFYTVWKKQKDGKWKFVWD